MDYNAFFGEATGSDESVNTSGGTPLAQTWNTPEPSYVDNSTGSTLDTIKSIGAAPFQAVGGLAQGIANFVVGGAVSGVGAEIATGAGVVNPLTPNNIERMGLNAKRFFLPFLFDEADQQALNANNEQWNRGADEWVKQYHAFSESVAEHPLFKPSTIDNAMGGGYKGSENIQGLLGAATTWVADQGRSAGNAVMDWASKNPEKAQELAKQGVTPESFIRNATAIETAINSIPLIVPYFGRDSYVGIRDKLKNLKKANDVGDIPNTMSGKYNRPENATEGGVARNFL